MPSRSISSSSKKRQRTYSPQQALPMQPAVIEDLSSDDEENEGLQQAYKKRALMQSSAGGVDLGQFVSKAQRRGGDLAYLKTNKSQRQRSSSQSYRPPSQSSRAATPSAASGSAAYRSSSSSGSSHSSSRGQRASTPFSQHIPAMEMKSVFLPEGGKLTQHSSSLTRRRSEEREQRSDSNWRSGYNEEAEMEQVDAGTRVDFDDTNRFIEPALLSQAIVPLRSSSSHSRPPSSSSAFSSRFERSEEEAAEEHRRQMERTRGHKQLISVEKPSPSARDKTQVR